MTPWDLVPSPQSMVALKSLIDPLRLGSVKVATEELKLAPSTAAVLAPTTLPRAASATAKTLFACALRPESSIVTTAP